MQVKSKKNVCMCSQKSATTIPLGNKRDRTIYYKSEYSAMARMAAR